MTPREKLILIRNNSTFQAFKAYAKKIEKTDNIGPARAHHVAAVNLGFKSYNAFLAHLGILD